MKKNLFVGGANLAGLMARAPAALGAARPRADATDPKALFAQINEAVIALREKVDAKADDVVMTEQIDRINATISDLQKAQDDAARKAAAATSGAGGRVVPDAAYSDTFMAYMRGTKDSSEVKASLNKGTGGEGSFVAPVEWDRSITDKLIEYGSMRSIATVVNIGTAGYKKVANLRGTVSGWVGETAARPETATPTFGEIPMFFGELYANPAATEQIVDDVEFDLEAWLAGEIALEFLKAEGTAFVGGTAANQPAGFLTYATGGTRAATNPLGAIEVKTSGAAAALTEPNALVNLAYALPSFFRGGARFVMNRLTEGVIRTMKDGQGRYIWQPGLTEGAPATLLGYPVTELPEMPNIAANALAVGFGNFAQGYEIAERRMTSILRDPYTNKPYIHYYATKRVGGGVVNPEALKLLRIAV